MPCNPFSGMDVNEIPIEIVDNINDESTLENVEGVMKCASFYMPLTDKDRKIAGFNLV